MYPHLRKCMRFSDSTYYDIPKPIEYAKGDSSLLNSDESMSDENSSQNDPTSSHRSKALIPPITSSTNFFSKDNSSTISTDNTSFKQLIETHQNELSINKSRHQSQNQSILPNFSFDRNNETHYNLRHQTKKDYRLFIPPSNF